MWTSADYELAWPREIFVRELEAIVLRPRYLPVQPGHVECLLAEAFVGEEPVNTYTAAWRTGESGEFVRELLAHRHDTVESSANRPYWLERRFGRVLTVDRAMLGGRFAQLINDLRNTGYLDNALTERCPEDEPSDVVVVDPVHLIRERLGRRIFWPLEPESWDEDTFYGLVEVFHDLVARPRSFEDCDVSGCIGHYSDFSVETGRALYRWRVNRLLEASGDPLRLADAGEDVGRLVQATDDARADLVARALTTKEPRTAARVAHAISLFRRRDATEDDKRSAIVALALILEERRKLLKAELFTKDEGALFTLANEFDLRHRDDKQHTDYDPVFREWVFWWYLATVELTNRLIDRQRGQVAATAT